MSPELRGEILAMNLITQNDHPQRLRRIILRLEYLLALADVLGDLSAKAVAAKAGVP
jgi:DnaJ-domain-containing protein 1